MKKYMMFAIVSVVALIISALPLTVNATPLYQEIAPFNIYSSEAGEKTEE